MTTTDELSVNAGGDITDASGEAVTVGGETSLDAGGSNVVLDNADTHDFAEAESFNAIAANVTVDDIDGIQLGVVTTTDELSVNAGGNITDASGEAVTVGGETSLDAGSSNVVLDLSLIHI